jgi:hypothetical protein
MAKADESIGFKILARMKGGDASRVWTPRDFIDLGTRTAVDVALHWLEDGQIQSSRPLRRRRRKHRRVLWNHTQITKTSGTSEEVRDRVKHDHPGGFSGPLVWNTRLVGHGWTFQDGDPAMPW